MLLLAAGAGFRLRCRSVRLGRDGVIRYLETLGLTIAVEVAIALFIIPRSLWRRRIGDVVLVNLASHPLATLAVRNLAVPWIVAELLVTAGEAAHLPLPLGLLVGRARCCCPSPATR